MLSHFRAIRLEVSYAHVFSCFYCVMPAGTSVPE
jgi:hypothetical protein